MWSTLFSLWYSDIIKHDASWLNIGSDNFMLPNKQVSQMRVPLATHPETAGDQNGLPKVLYVFEHKTWYILIHAPHTRIMAFWQSPGLVLWLCVYEPFPISSQFHMPFYVKNAIMDNFMCLLESDCTNKLRMNNHPYPMSLWMTISQHWFRWWLGNYRCQATT